MNTNAPTPPAPSPAPSRRLWLVTGALVLVAGGVTLGVLQPWRKPPPVQTLRLGSSLELAAGEVLLVGKGKSERLLGSSDWREFSFVFVVPEANCGAQLLQLVLDSRIAAEQQVAGEAWFDDLQIQRLEQPAPSLRSAGEDGVERLSEGAK